MGSIEVVCFKLGEQEFAIPIQQVREITPSVRMTRVIHTSELIAGVTNIRGVIIALLNIKHLLGLAQTALKSDGKIIVIQHEQKTAGIVIDDINTVKTIDESEIARLEYAGNRANCCSGVVQLPEGPLTLLDTGQILECDALAQYA